MGEVVAEDLNQMTSSQISAALHYPLNRIISHIDIEKQSRVKWWLIAAILGSGAIIFLIGWVSLFIYYNTCGSSHKIEEGDYMSRAERAKLQKGIIINPNPPWTRGIYDHPLGEPWVDPGPVPDANGKIKEPRYKRSFRTLSEARLEKRLKEEREAMAKAMTEIAKRAAEKTRAWDESQQKAAKQRLELETEASTANSEPSNVKEQEGESARKNKKTVEPKKRNTKVQPVSLNVTDLSSEVSGTSSDETQKQYEGFSTLSNVPSKKIARNQDTYTSEPENEVGSSTSEEGPSEPPKRPLSAKKERTRLFVNDENMQKQSRQTPRVWSPYTAGDCVSFWSNNPNNYPRPSSPTKSGIIEVKSKE